MKNKLSNISILIVSILTSVVAYFYLPETIASHWDYLGQPNGYSSKLFTLILFPVMIVFIYALLMIVPKLDPMKKNIDKFMDSFSNFVTVILLFLVLVQYQVLLWNLGVQISFNISFPILLGLLFFFIGDLLEKSKRNWSVGIRTPWTLSSDYVWEKTHKLGGKLFKASLILFLFALIIPGYSFILVVGYLLATVVYLFVYSYLVIKEEHNKK